jgi:hypothetical protein
VKVLAIKKKTTSLIMVEKTPNNPGIGIKWKLMCGQLLQKLKKHKIFVVL